MTQFSIALLTIKLLIMNSEVSASYVKSRFTGKILQFYMNLLNEKESFHITALH